MALSFSKELKNRLLQGESLKQAISGGCLKIYAGTRPTNADTGIGTATLLATLSYDGLTYSETAVNYYKTSFIKITGDLGTGIVRITLGSTNYDFSESNYSSLQDLLINIATTINKRDMRVFVVPIFGTGITDTGVAISARTAGEDIYIYGDTVGASVSVTTIDGSSANRNSNGLILGTAVDGAISKESGVWKGIAIASGTATWFRIQGPGEDDDSTRYDLVRLDGTVGTSGADLILSSTSITSGATITVDSCTFTLI